MEEEKLPGVEEEGAAAIETGFATAGGDWEAAAPGFAGAAGGDWGDAPATGQEWGAAPATAAAAATWGEDASKETTQW